ncbi:MAG: chorismate mutase [Flavobacteriales bacterium]
MYPAELKLIAGPCSAESYQQLRTVAQQLVAVNLFAFRAGIWKPRTQPGAFEGAGEEGLAWMRDIQAEFGLNVLTEVANSSHVENVLNHGFNMMWIGARTTSNPFSVQELADSLQGTEATILIKNPTNPDLKLWVGGIERLYKAGVKKVIAIHRGFSTYDKQKYRNLPNWQIPIALRAEFPGLEIICDPSHISGIANNVFEVSQKAVDLKFDGLMIEVHPNPTLAKTDAKQQLTPSDYLHLLQHLNVRSREAIDQEEIRELRANISILDHQVIELFAKRMELVEQIGQYKKRNNIAIFQPNQWEEALAKFLKLSEDAELSKEFAAEVFKLIHQESIDIQSKILRNSDTGDTNR